MADNETLVTLTADIVAAWVANNRVATAELGDAIRQIHEALAGLGESAPEPEPEKQTPAVAIRSSVKPDYLVSLESGKKVKMLKRYLMSSYGMTPDDYRKKWGLPADYPMVAPKYAEQRRDLAKKIGLGRKARAPEGDGASDGVEDAGEATAGAEGEAPKPRRGRRPKQG